MAGATGYLDFWGKAQAAEGAKVGWHPAAWHCLDVAACAQELLAARAGESTRLAALLGMELEEFSRLAVFLVALHDIGKFSRGFQILAPEFWPESALGPCPPEGERHPGVHWQISYEILAGRLRGHVLKRFGLGDYEDVQPLLRAVSGHHGRPPSGNEDIYESQLCDRSVATARGFFDALFDLFQPPTPAFLEDETAQKRLSFWLAGLTVAADWLGSNQSIFRYEPPHGSLAEYWQQKALPRAREALYAAGLRAVPPVQNASLQTLFGIADARPMQAKMADLLLPAGPMLAIIEDATGAGKTEAALLLAARMMAAGKASGLYFALPTMATANAMFARLGQHYRNLFAPDADGKARPSLALAHGRRELQQDWFAAITPPDDARPSFTDENAETAAQCARWIADDRRKAFLAQIGAGTIDQALLAVLPSKFQCLRLWGLADRIIIVDEAHAYDAYMSKELETLLAFHAATGGSAIILSATLPGQKRAELIAAFRKGLGGRGGETPQDAVPFSDKPYPLVTIAERDHVREISGIKPAAHSVRSVEVQRLGRLEEALDAIEKAAAKGAAVAWIRNAVDDVIEAVALLRARGLKADLFHARFAMGDRQEIEKEQVTRFGKNGTEAARHGRVLVASQVIEQSLDLDFDLMISDLAPIDLLIQRAGRLWRHMDKRPEASRPVEGPRLLVLSPDPGDVRDENWLFAMGHKGAHVYPNHALLWRSAKILFDKGGFAAPDDLREMIEYVYADLQEAESPAVLKPKDEEAEGAIWGDRSSASFNLLQLKDGYVSAGSWLEEDAVHTRLGEPTRTIRLARIEGDALRPLCEDAKGKSSWPLSEISVPEKWLVGADISPQWAGAIEQIRQSWPKWQRGLLITPLDENGNLLLDYPAGLQPLHYDENGLKRLP